VFQDRGDEYRGWAKQCLAMAARGGGEEKKMAWLQLADKWQRLAEQAGNHNHVAQQAQQPQPEEKP
jgi:NAD-dependent oxidoreductase involved in siderophore biosynthesis